MAVFGRPDGSPGGDCPRAWYAASPRLRGGRRESDCEHPHLCPSWWESCFLHLSHPTSGTALEQVELRALLSCDSFFFAPETSSAASDTLAFKAWDALFSQHGTLETGWLQYHFVGRKY